MKSPVKPVNKKAAAKQAPGNKAAGSKGAGNKAAGTKTDVKKASVKKASVKKASVKKLGAAQKPALPLSSPAPVQAAEAAVMDRLFAVITARRTADPAHSHSARLLSRGMGKVAQKFGEEAVECLIEAVAGRAEALVAESADVLYHLLVMWVAAGVRPDQVWAELTRREGVSGVAEKAARTTQSVGTTKIP